MKTLAWNCRGLGTPGAVLALRRLINSQVPDVVFLSETKKLDSEMIPLRGIGECQNIFPFSCLGVGNRKSGGLCLLWRNTVDIDIISASRNHIHFWVTNLDCGFISLATGIYGFPEAANKWRTR